MVAGGLVLSPAQRSLVEKSLAVRRARDEKESIQSAIEDASRRHIDEVKARCRMMHHRSKDAQERDHRLIIRHVGEQLANVAKRELLQDPLQKVGHKKPSKPETKNAAQPGGAGAHGSRNHHSSRRETIAGECDDAYDEERFGSVRRPPRVRPPNLWVSVSRFWKHSLVSKWYIRVDARLTWMLLAVV